MTIPARTLRDLAFVLLPVALSLALLASLYDRDITQKLYLGASYYLLLGTVLCWAGTHLYAARDCSWRALIAWVQDNRAGLVVAISVTAVAALAVEPALRVLSDEANLVGTSKNLFASRSPTFTVSGKFYYGSYWDVDVAIDQRPPLFPFLVSLIHVALGYSYRNVFVFNLLLLPAFILTAYRLAKSLAGETFGVVAALLVVAHPIVLLSVRSGGFDFLAAFLALLVVRSFLVFARRQRPRQLAILWVNLCLFATVRYESALFIAPVVGSLLVLRMVHWRTLRPFALLYALTPAFLAPRIWLSLLRGSVPKQSPGTVAVSVENVLGNAYGYFQPLLEPLGSFPAHDGLLLALGLLGCGMGLRWLLRRLAAGDWSAPETKFAWLVIAWLGLQCAILFSYAWGRAQYPSAARLFIPLDVSLSLMAAWVLTRTLERYRRFVPILIAGAIVTTQLPVAAQGRMMNRLTQTRESAATWRFFEGVPEQQILVVTDRPNHFTIMNYGAMTFENARRDPYLLTAFQRRLFQDIYVIQQLKQSTLEPLPGYELWSDRELAPVFEFQNDANVLLRVSRLAR